MVIVKKRFLIVFQQAKKKIGKLKSSKQVQSSKENLISFSLEENKKAGI